MGRFELPRSFKARPPEDRVSSGSTTSACSVILWYGAGDGTRTRGLCHGKATFYQLNYARSCNTISMVLRAGVEPASPLFQSGALTTFATSARRDGGRGRPQTCGLFDVNEALCQLSYSTPSLSLKISPFL